MVFIVMLIKSTELKNSSTHLVILSFMEATAAFQWNALTGRFEITWIALATCNQRISVNIFIKSGAQPANQSTKSIIGILENE